MCLAVLLEGHALLQALLRIDPELAATYHQQEEQRIQWGKEVWRQTQIEVEATPNDSVPPRLLVPDVNHALYHLLTDDDYERRDA
jgi:tRNA A37 N6-isopentenylltransferase MiaA